MTNTPTPLGVLNALYVLARLSLPASPALISRHLGLCELEVRHELKRLDEKGLATADTCRLTLRGLAVIHAHLSQAPSAVALSILAA